MVLLAHTHLTHDALERARSQNLGHRLIAVANDFSRRVLEAYAARGYGMVRPVHGGLLRNLPLEGSRLTLLARRAGITHRAMAKIVDEVAAMGFVTRAGDPADGRVSLVCLTPAGMRLLRDSSEIIERITEGYSVIAGARRMARLESQLFDFIDRLGIEVTPGGQQALHSTAPERLRRGTGTYLSHNLGRYLQLAGDDYYRRCAADMAQRGHRGVRFDHLSVLAHLSLDGMRLSELAQAADVSLQAMGKQVRKVQRTGYISQQVDPADRRGRVVQFTESGLAFVEDLLASFDEIDRQYREELGASRVDALQSSLAEVIAALSLNVPSRQISRL